MRPGTDLSHLIELRPKRDWLGLRLSALSAYADGYDGAWLMVAGEAHSTSDDGKLEFGRKILVTVLDSSGTVLTKGVARLPRADFWAFQTFEVHARDRLRDSEPARIRVTIDVG